MGLTKWTSEMTSKFISLYREQECIWRIDTLTYRNRDARDTALRNIIVGMNLEHLTIDDVKKKIKHLRSTYMTEVNKIGKTARSGAGTSTIYKPSFTWFNEMDAFIKYVNVKRNTQSSSIAQPNTKDPESDEQPVSDTCKETATGNVETNHQINTNRKLQDCQKRNTDIQPDVTKEIPNKTDINQPSHTVSKRSRLSKLCSAVKDMQGISMEMNKVEDTNEFEIYGKYVGVQLKSMNEEDAILAQQEIQLILTRFKLKKVQSYHHTAQTPSMSPSQISDYQSSSCGIADSNSQSRRPSHYDSASTSYDNNHPVAQYVVPVAQYTSDESNGNETNMAAVVNLSAAGLQYSDVQYNVEINDYDETDNETDMAIANLGLINTAFRNA